MSPGGEGARCGSHHGSGDRCAPCVSFVGSYQELEMIDTQAGAWQKIDEASLERL